MYLKKKRDSEVVNVITKNDLLKYRYLDLKGKIIIKKDHGSCIVEIELRFKNYFPAFVRVWPSDFNTTNNMSLAESDISFEEIVLSSKSL